MIGAIVAAALVQAQACPASVTLPAALEIPLVTTQPLSSKKQVKGDMVVLRTSVDVLVDGVVVIPKGTEATGQVSDARATGGLGINGKLVVAPIVSGKSANIAAGTAIPAQVLKPVIICPAVEK